MWMLGRNLKDFLRVKFSLGTETGYPKPEDVGLPVAPIQRGRGGGLGHCSKSVGNLRAWHDKKWKDFF